MELKEAYEILGVDKDSGLDEVEKRYDLILRRARSRQGTVPGTAYTLEEVNRAYKSIKEAEREASAAQFAEAKYGKGVQRGTFKEKADYFWEYYRWYVIGGILGLILIGMIIDGVIEQRRQAALPPPNLSVMLYGAFYNADTAKLEQFMMDNNPTWERVKATLTYVPEEIRSGYDAALQQKSIVALVADRPDVYIVDRNNFGKLANQGAFMPLDDWVRQQTPALSEEKLITGTHPETGETHVFGIDVTDHPLWSDIQVPSKEKIIGIGFDAKNRNHAEQFILDLLP